MKLQQIGCRYSLLPFRYGLRNFHVLKRIPETEVEIIPIFGKEHKCCNGINPPLEGVRQEGDLGGAESFLKKQHQAGSNAEVNGWPHF